MIPVSRVFDGYSDDFYVFNEIENKSYRFVYNKRETGN